MQLLSLNRAAVAPLPTAQGSVASAIRKQPVAGVVAVGVSGLDGDAQADLAVHGGLRKALYAYPAEHYPFWQTVRGQAKVTTGEVPLPAGSLGENLTLRGLLETQVWVGDRLCFAACELVVTEPRQPCFKFNAVMGFNQAAKLMVQSGYCGFYLAVLRPGTLRADETFQLRPGPREVSIPELFRLAMRGTN